MYFDNFQALLNMDGHGVYVWSAYVITAAVLCGLVWAPIRRKNTVTRLLKARQRRRT